MSNKPVLFVIGASGNIGKATLGALSAKYAEKFNIHAGVRNPGKSEELSKLPGVSVVQAEMGNDKLKETLKGVDALYIVTPGAENRAPLTLATAQAAKVAGVKFLLVVSVATAELKNTIFGRQLSEIEEGVSKLGIPYCFLRLPLFVDNNWGFKDTIQGQSTIYCPVDPEKPFTAVVVEGAGRASATILANYSKHTNTTYTLISDRYTYTELSKAFSNALGREISYVLVPNKSAKEAFMGAGYPEWQVDGIIELFDLINSGSSETNFSDLSDYKKITGEDPTSITQWIEKYGGAFK